MAFHVSYTEDSEGFVELSITKEKYSTNIVSFDTYEEAREYIRKFVSGENTIEVLKEIQYKKEESKILWGMQSEMRVNLARFYGE